MHLNFNNHVILVRFILLNGFNLRPDTTAPRIVHIILPRLCCLFALQVVDQSLDVLRYLIDCLVFMQRANNLVYPVRTEVIPTPECGAEKQKCLNVCDAYDRIWFAFLSGGKELECVREEFLRLCIRLQG